MRSLSCFKVVNIKALPYGFSVCKVSELKQSEMSEPFTFTAATDTEKSLVCITENVPKEVISRSDGWKAFRIEGTLDFSLVGILAGISSLLAENNIGIFAVSTYDTDYIFVKKENFSRALSVLKDNGYGIMI